MAHMDTKHYFEVTQGKTHKVFGPYPTVDAARKAPAFVLGRDDIRLVFSS
jgi:hypothetical protein